ncbi:hypothetical protein DIPPA_35142 [Diplonema papillatum]|nr:hypothetical protein DIPPA_35142 [Diplonema papillatum]
MNGADYGHGSASSDSDSDCGYVAARFAMLGEVDWELVCQHPAFVARGPLAPLLGDTSATRVGSRASGARVLWVKKPNTELASIYRIPSLPGAVVDTANRLDSDFITQALRAEAPDTAEVLWTLLKVKYPSLTEASLLNAASPPAKNRHQPAAADPGTPTLDAMVADSPPPIASDSASESGDGRSQTTGISGRSDPLGSEHGKQPSGSWGCACGHLNVGFKARCEACGSHPPAGWWKRDSSGPKLPSLAAEEGNADYPAARRLDSAGSAAGLNGAGKTQTLRLTRANARVGWTLNNDDLTVVTVDKGSPAQRAGVVPGLRILAIGEFPTSTVEDVRTALAASGHSFDLVVAHGGAHDGAKKSQQQQPQQQQQQQAPDTVSVILQKGPTDRMGTFWVDNDNLVLKEVTPGTAAEQAGLAALVGWRLTHVNSVPVHCTDDILGEATGQSVLSLDWERPSPDAALPLLQQNFLAQQQQHLQAFGGMDAMGVVGLPGISFPTLPNMPNMMMQQPLTIGIGGSMGVNVGTVPGMGQVVIGQRPNSQSVKHMMPLAPSVLWVVAKDKVPHCGGPYRLEKEMFNGQPSWKHCHKALFLYCSGSPGLWCISDSKTNQNGWIFSMVSAASAMPDKVANWESLGRQDPNVKVVSQLQVAANITVDTHGALLTVPQNDIHERNKLESVKGVYSLQRDGDLIGEPVVGIPFKLFNGMPVWKGSKENFIFSNKKGHWLVSDDPQDLTASPSATGAALVSKIPHGGVMPVNIQCWTSSDKHDRTDVKVVAGLDVPETPKANVTASVHENAVWHYQDVGGFRLAQHLLKSDKTAEHLLWVVGDAAQPQCGWIGLDLSNEPMRGNLVRVLTDLVDQESIVVKQPIVAGVTVRTTDNITTPEGETLSAGLTGQVVSVMMSQHPVGNCPPRMAKVNFYGTKTVTVSYGQVEPVQGPFDLGAKVRVLAVDAVAVVDSEAASASGPAVRGKYRIKYATGKTYHVRNFALINADKPWGDGDEAAIDRTFKEGVRVALSDNIAFNSLDGLAKGTEGVVTHTSSYEVLIGGYLFIANPEQLQVTTPFKKGDMVSPTLHPPSPRPWTIGKVEAVARDECTILLPTGETVTLPKACLRVEHFCLDQEVLALRIGSDTWETGRVAKVLPSGMPVVQVGDRPMQRYWFVCQKWEGGKLPKAMLQASDVDDDDPLQTMGSYLTMDDAMLKEAEIMRRKWIESQRLRDAIQLRLQSMADEQRIKRLEASCNHVVLRKGKQDSMGTNFHDEETLVLEYVHADTAAQRCGVGRFKGRLLASIDNIPVRTCQNIKVAAAGKDIMNLQFDPTPFCPAGHPMQIILNQNTNAGACPGCYKPYNVAYYGCQYALYLHRLPTFFCVTDAFGVCSQKSSLRPEKMETSRPEQGVMHCSGWVR